MPEVRVLYKSEKMPDDARRSLSGMLPKIVAAAFHVEHIKALHLTRGDIGVEFKAAGPDDVLTHDIQIKVTANYHPERFKKLDEAAVQITREVRPLIPSLRTFYVWPLLSVAAFIESEGTGGIEQ